MILLRKEILINEMQEKHPEKYTEIMDILTPAITDQVHMYQKDKEEYDYYEDKDSPDRRELIKSHIEKLE